MFFLFSDKQAVTGAFKATGSKDPDVLYTTKQAMIGPTKFIITLSWVMTAAAVLLSLTIIGAFVGIPMILACWYIRRKCKNYVSNVESAYAVYVNQVPLTS